MEYLIAGVFVLIVLAVVWVMAIAWVMARRESRREKMDAMVKRTQKLCQARLKENMEGERK